MCGVLVAVGQVDGIRAFQFRDWVCNAATCAYTAGFRESYLDGFS